MKLQIKIGRLEKQREKERESGNTCAVSGGSGLGDQQLALLGNPFFTRHIGALSSAPRRGHQLLPDGKRKEEDIGESRASWGEGKGTSKVRKSGGRGKEGRRGGARQRDREDRGQERFSNRKALA